MPERRLEVPERRLDVPERRLDVPERELSYVSDSHVLLLQSVQVEGRCAEAEAEERCTLPPMKLGYTHVQTNAQGEGVFVNGFEVIDDTVRAITNSPKHSVDEDYTDLYDVNADGLPDVGRVRHRLHLSRPALRWRAARVQGLRRDHGSFGW